MTTSRLAGMTLALLLVTAVAGCASQKEPAEQAVASLDTSLQNASATAQKYLPDEFAAASAKVDELKQSLASEDYSAVVDAAPGIATEIRKLAADSAIRKAMVRVEMDAEWVEMVKTMPEMISATDTRMLRMRGGKLPQGMSRDAFKEANAAMDTARSTWGKAAEAGNNGDVETAVTLTREARATVEQVRASIGM